MVKSVSVIGLGSLGAPMAACLAARGLRVKAADLNPKKVEASNGGVAPVREPRLEELIPEAVRYVRLEFGGAAERHVEATSSGR